MRFVGFYSIIVAVSNFVGSYVDTSAVGKGCDSETISSRHAGSFFLQTQRFKLKSPLCGTIKRQPTILKNIEEASK